MLFWQIVFLTILSLTFSSCRLRNTNTSKVLNAEEERKKELKNKLEQALAPFFDLFYAKEPKYSGLLELVSQATPEERKGLVYAFLEASGPDDITSLTSPPDYHLFMEKMKEEYTLYRQKYNIPASPIGAIALKVHDFRRRFNSLDGAKMPLDKAYTIATQRLGSIPNFNKIIKDPSDPHQYHYLQKLQREVLSVEEEEDLSFRNKRQALVKEFEAWKNNQQAQMSQIYNQYLKDVWRVLKNHPRLNNVSIHNDEFGEDSFVILDRNTCLELDPATMKKLANIYIEGDNKQVILSESHNYPFLPPALFDLYVSSLEGDSLATLRERLNDLRFTYDVFQSLSDYKWLVPGFPHLTLRSDPSPHLDDISWSAGDHLVDNQSRYLPRSLIAERGGQFMGHSLLGEFFEVYPATDVSEFLIQAFLDNDSPLIRRERLAKSKNLPPFDLKYNIRNLQNVLNDVYKLANEKKRQWDPTFLTNQFPHFEELSFLHSVLSFQEKKTNSAANIASVDLSVKNSTLDDLSSVKTFLENRQVEAFTIDDKGSGYRKMVGSYLFLPDRDLLAKNTLQEVFPRQGMHATIVRSQIKFRLREGLLDIGKLQGSDFVKIQIYDANQRELVYGTDFKVYKIPNDEGYFAQIDASKHGTEFTYDIIFDVKSFADFFTPRLSLKIENIERFKYLVGEIEKSGAKVLAYELKNLLALNAIGTKIFLDSVASVFADFSSYYFAEFFDGEHKVDGSGIFSEFSRYLNADGQFCLQCRHAEKLYTMFVNELFQGQITAKGKSVFLINDFESISLANLHSISQINDPRGTFFQDTTPKMQGDVKKTFENLEKQAEVWKKDNQELAQLIENQGVDVKAKTEKTLQRNIDYIVSIQKIRSSILSDDMFKEVVKNPSSPALKIWQLSSKLLLLQSGYVQAKDISINGKACRTFQECVKKLMTEIADVDKAIDAFLTKNPTGGTYKELHNIDFLSKVQQLAKSISYNPISGLKKEEYDKIRAELKNIGLCDELAMFSAAKAP